MQTLCLYPVMRDARQRSDEPHVFQIQAEECGSHLHALWRDAEGNLSVHADREKPKLSTATLIGKLASRSTAESSPTWWLIPVSPVLSIDGVRPLPLAAIEPGVIFADGAFRWLVTSLWTPTPKPAPESVSDRECPVCGGELNLVPVVECACGRFYHLEDPARPDDQSLLNCYLSGGQCGLCERVPSLEPAFMPQPNEALLD